jgi:ADP-ribose pyrophosphatase YjhB (NUDIX family)
MDVQRVYTQTFGAVGALIEKEGRVLLVRENQPGYPDDKKWSHPAGWIDAGENPVDGVKREVREETGFEFEPTCLIGVYSLVRNDLVAFWGTAPHPIKIIFGGKVANYSEKNLLGDTSETKWFLPEEIYGMDSNTLREADIKQIVKDYFSGKRYPLEIITHTVMEDAQSEKFVFRGKVIRGKGRGKALGFPTANLDVPGIKLAHGVYLAEAKVSGQKYQGLIFFGPKETFGEPPSLEIFIKGLTVDIYGQTVAVRIIKKIRDVKKFDNPLELRKQIERDARENLS